MSVIPARLKDVRGSSEGEKSRGMMRSGAWWEEAQAEGAEPGKGGPVPVVRREFSYGTGSPVRWLGGTGS